MPERMRRHVAPGQYQYEVRSHNVAKSSSFLSGIREETYDLGYHSLFRPSGASLILALLTRARAPAIELQALWPWLLYRRRVAALVSGPAEKAFFAWRWSHRKSQGRPSCFAPDKPMRKPLWSETRSIRFRPRPPFLHSNRPLPAPELMPLFSAHLPA
jgi:hypothetical protein